MCSSLYVRICIFWYKKHDDVTFVAQRVACLLRKVVQEIERRISTQADHLRTVNPILNILLWIFSWFFYGFYVVYGPQQNNLFKIREEKYKSRIRVLETLAAGNGEEIKVGRKKRLLV